MKSSFYVCLIYSLLILSCSGKRESKIITFKLNKSDYTDKVSIWGTVQSANNTPVLPPRTSYSQMTVVRLAKDGSFVKKGDTLCVFSIPELETMDRDLLTSIENLNADLKKTEADNKLNIALQEAQLATSDAQLKIALIDTLKMKYANEVNRKLMDLEMKKVIIEKQKIVKKLASTKLVGETEIRQKKARITQEKTKEQTIADQLKSLVLIAERDGVVMRTEAPKIIVISSGGGTGTYGGPIREGSVIFILTTPVLLFPDLSKMQISADVSESVFKRVEKGQKVNIYVSAGEQVVTTGRINRKNLAPSQSMRNSGSKVKFFEVIIDVDSCHLKMKPGLSANCEIIIREESDTIFVPNLALFEKGNTKQVYVKEKDLFKAVKVKTGTIGSSYTIIAEGLKGDELISLSEPPYDLIIHDSVKKDSTISKKQ